jgi:phosphatidylserine/phosphatidylglycerophosphate/cardiolipin synthase-like enzyme
LIELHTLTHGGQTAADVAGLLARFLSEARSTLDIAVYDAALGSDATAVLEALTDATSRGVRVRLMYNTDHARPIPVPPPPRTEPTPLSRTGADVRAIPGVPDLMHHKYVVRDGAAVWTGSTNWTHDAWTREENVIVVAQSTELAAAFSRDFDDLWNSGRVAASGKFTTPPVSLGDATVRPLFCPGRAQRLTHRISGAIGRAQRRVRIASPVITSGPVLGTLSELVASRRVDVAGVYDATQMREVVGQWRAEGHATWKIPCFESLVTGAPFGAKESTPYAPGSVHDYMHAKVCVVDDICFVGSYNFSHSGEDNAENVLEIADPAVADRFAAFVDETRARYRTGVDAGDGPVFGHSSVT